MLYTYNDKKKNKDSSNNNNSRIANSKTRDLGTGDGPALEWEMDIWHPSPQVLCYSGLGFRVLGSLILRFCATASTPSSPEISICAVLGAGQVAHMISSLDLWDCRKSEHLEKDRPSCSARYYTTLFCASLCYVTLYYTTPYCAPVLLMAQTNQMLRRCKGGTVRCGPRYDVGMDSSEL